MTAPQVIDDDELYVEDGTFVWQDKPFTGIAREYRSDGSVVSDTSYVNGVQEGVARSYHAPGKLYSETYYSGNSFHGPSREWNEDGRLVDDAFYEHGILVRQKKWDDSGKLVEEFELTKDDRLFKTLQDYRRKFGSDVPR